MGWWVFTNFVGFVVLHPPHYVPAQNYYPGIRIMHLSELDGKVFNSCWRIRNPIWPLVEDFLQEILFVLSLWPKLVQICTFAGSWKPASWMPMSSFKRKKFACDFDFSDVVTCGVAVTLYGQTCIYIYMHIIHTTFVCIYAFVLLAENIYSAVLNLYTGCFAVYAKRISQLVEPHMLNSFGNLTGCLV